MQTDATQLLDQLQSPDAKVRYQAWQSAGAAGAGAVSGLGDLMASPDKSIAKCAHGALDVIAHYAARSGSGSMGAHDVTKALLKLSDSTRPRMVRADALYLVGMVGDGRAVPVLVKLMADKEIREDARMALERIPGSAATNALKKAEPSAPDDYKPNIEQSLYDRNLTPQSVGVARLR